MSKDEVFQSGEREAKKAFEEVTTRNVKTILEYTRETRRIVRELEERVVNLEKANLGLEVKILDLQRQIQLLQIKLYNNGI